ncbi:MAG: tyrosine-type recombinase/integrase [Oscillospiraceae bacterium]|jgi:integrase|nr:tyrosine-type recombinase/integrase [Oscillospiraceae bacterium]
MHSLRHTSASILINAQTDAFLVSNAMGHSNVRITQDIYAHAFADAKSKVAAVIENELFSNRSVS